MDLKELNDKRRFSSVIDYYVENGADFTGSDFHQLGDAYVGIASFDEAEIAYWRSLHRGGGGAWTWANLGRLAGRKGDMDLAKVYFARAAKISNNPDIAKLLRNAEQGKYEE